MWSGGNAVELRMEEIRVEEEPVSPLMNSGTPIPCWGGEPFGIRLQIIPFIFKFSETQKSNIFQFSIIFNITPSFYT